MYRITETLHHGATHAVRHTDVPRLDLEAVRTALADSMYAYNPKPEYVQTILGELVAGREAGHGWSRFTCEELNPVVVQAHALLDGSNVVHAEYVRALTELAVAVSGHEADSFAADQVRRGILAGHDLTITPYVPVIPRSAAIYRPPADAVDDDSDPTYARLVCPHCGSDAVVEVDKAVRWNEYHEDTDTPNVIVFRVGGDADFDSDCLLCTSCHVELDAPVEVAAGTLDWDYS